MSAAEPKELEYPQASSYTGTSGASSAMKKSSSGKVSKSSSEESVAGTRSVIVTVVSDTGTKVQLMLKAHGMKKKHGFLHSITTAFKKPSTPSKLIANGHFTKFDLTANSLSFSLDIRTDKKKKKGNANRVDTFALDIKQFPSNVNPDSAEFEVMEPASGESFILLSLIKVDNLSINWKEFLSSNGTLDVTMI